MILILKIHYFTEESPFLCPSDMQCPLNTEILCNQFRFILKCCCPEGVNDELNKKPEKEKQDLIDSGSLQL